MLFLTQMVDRQNGHCIFGGCVWECVGRQQTNTTSQKIFQTASFSFWPKSTRVIDLIRHYLLLLYYAYRTLPYLE